MLTTIKCKKVMLIFIDFHIFEFKEMNESLALRYRSQLLLDIKMPHVLNYLKCQPTRSEKKYMKKYH